MRDGHRGATLVDLVLTVLILGILAAAGVPKFSAALHRTRADSAARRIEADLRWARQRAMTVSAAQTVRFTTATHSYELPGVGDLEHAGGTYSVALSDAPYRTSLLSADTGGGDAEIEFDRFGRPDGAATIVVSAGGNQRTVTVDADTGQARIP